MVEIVSQRQFWDRKVDSFIQMYLYGRDNQQQFINNMLLMGFEEEDIFEFLEEAQDG